MLVDCVSIGKDYKYIQIVPGSSTYFSYYTVFHTCNNYTGTNTKTPFLNMHIYILATTSQPYRNHVIKFLKSFEKRLGI